MTATTEPDLLAEQSDALTEFVATATGRAIGDKDRAVALYYAIRDGINYEVFDTDISPAGLRPSSVLAAGRGFCLHKSILFAAAVRTLDIPSALVCSSVRNHLTSPALRELVGGEVFLHWYTKVRINGQWVAATPVFNKLLCRMYGMAPLPFDGSTDSTAQPADTTGGVTMEFLDEPQEFHTADPETLADLIRRAHPRMCRPGGRVPGEREILTGTGNPR